jgi:hypothetical protein
MLRRYAVGFHLGASRAVVVSSERPTLLLPSLAPPVRLALVSELS